MILEEDTFEAFGYYPSKLPLKSHKPILVVCDKCNTVRTIKKYSYCALCRSCSMLRNTSALGYICTEGTKQKIGEAVKGDKNGNYKGGLVTCVCLQCGREFEVKQSQIKRGGGKYCSHSCMAKAHKGNKNYNYNGGEKMRIARKNAKRRHELCYTLLMPLNDGEVGHHVTNEYVVGIPVKVHEKLSGYTRKKHRTRILQWLKMHDKKKYKLVLCVLAKEPLGNSS